MMKRITIFFERLFSLRNLPPILIIIFAIVGSLDIHPFGLTLRTDQIILALLAFLAIDSLVERLDLLGNLETGVNILLQSITPNSSADLILKRRRDLPRIEKDIIRAQKEIWITGITLDTTITLMSTIETKIKEGCKVKFLALDPDGDAIELAAQFYGASKSSYANRIRSNLTYLAERLKSANGQQVEIKVLDAVFPTGYLVIDPQSSKSTMHVQSYMYQIDPEESPILTLSRERDSYWFVCYYEQLQNIWETAHTFPKPTSEADTEK